MAVPDDEYDPNLMALEKFCTQIKEKKASNSTEIFKAILNALLDIRLRLPPIYNLSPGNILVNKATKDVKIIVNDVLFERQSSIVNLSKEDLTYVSPEELQGFGRSLTTPFWVLGCMLYEARFGFNPFRSHLKA